MFDHTNATAVETMPPRRIAQTVNVPLNRVEGDLEIRVEIVDGTVVDAWSAGTLYRGFENLLTGRAALDSLVLTPRVCGICSTAHLTAAAKALESVSGATPPPDAVRIRNITLMAELLQSDVRQTNLMFMPDFANPAYAAEPFYDEAVRRFAALQGESVIETIRETKRILEIVALLGGQWPHSSYMVPGGVVSIPSAVDLTHCRCILRGFTTWYEHRILGCRLERWNAVRNLRDLNHWLEERDEHRQSDLGCLLRLGRAIGLDSLGAGPNHFLSVGGLEIPPDSAVHAPGVTGTYLLPAGFAIGQKVSTLDQRKIAEDVSHSYCANYTGERHPHHGETRPVDPASHEKKYSWAKAPRYDGAPAETGPLAERIIAGNELYLEWCSPNPNALARQMARLTRPATLIAAMDRWLSEITPEQPCYSAVADPISGEGCGLTEAARGALGHWVRIADGKIEHYQLITPTAWNGSPRDARNHRGPWEEALIGTPVRDSENPVELGHVIRSFDPCLVCTVHALHAKRNPHEGGAIRI